MLMPILRIIVNVIADVEVKANQRRHQNAPNPRCLTSPRKSEVNMPCITIDGPRLEIAKKRELVREVTEAAVKAYGLPKEAMVVILKENLPENVGVGGELLIDKVKGG
jgi:4-oxalocrotonate tautomerase